MDSALGNGQAQVERTRLRQRSGGLWANATLAFAITTIGILTAFGMVGWQLVTKNAELRLESQRDNARTLTSYIDSRILALRRIVTSASASAITSRALGQSGAARLAASRELLAVLPYARRVDIFETAAAREDLGAEVPITFAALDVIKRARAGAFVGPEASISQPDLLYTASPISRDGLIVGVLFVAFSKEALIEPLNAAFDPQMGSLTLHQTFEGSAATPVLEWGNGIGAPALVDTAVPHWRVAYQRANVTAEGFGWSSLLLPLLLALALTLGGIALAFARLAKRLSSDAATLTEYAGKLVRGRKAQPQRYELPLFANVASNLRDQSKEEVVEPSGPRSLDELTSPADDDLKAAIESVRNRNIADPGSSGNAPANDSAEEPLVVTTRKAAPVVDDNFGIEVNEENEPSPADITLDPDIFRAYDIRGITDTNLTEDVVYWIGRAFAAEASVHGQSRVAIGRDGRLSSPVLAGALSRGLREGGVNVVDIGEVPTPLLYFATHALDTGTGIMITGSHNPPDYNGLKMMMAGETLAEARIQTLRQRIEQEDLPIGADGDGIEEQIDVVATYLERVLEDVVLAQPLKVVVDCGNGVAGAIAPRLLEELGCEVVTLYCDVDGTFPNHHPDPAEPENLQDLITVVQAEKADVGLAFDGDGDRLGVVTPRGDIIWPDKLMMLFSQDIVSRNPGADIIFDVKCSRHLNNLISEYGGRPIMWKTGHSHIKAKMKESGALLGGEFSGHICFGERWYGFDDALYAAARLLEIVAAESSDLDELFSQFPVTFSTPELKIKTTDKEKFVIMDQLKAAADFGDGTITSIDGVRVDFDDGWGLIRPSNTSPVLSLRFEADNAEALQRVQASFRDQLKAISPALEF